MHTIGDENDIKYSVVIPAYNAERTLADCLQALEDQSIPRKAYEVIVVDDGSSDSTAKIAGRFQIKYFHQSNRGPAAARNLGARAASGQILLFTDSDCIPASNWLEEMVRPFEDPDIVAVKGAYKTNQSGLAARFAQVEFEDRYDLLETQPSIDMIDTYSAAFRRDVFMNMGGFDQSFPVANNEDTDLSYRLAAAGYKMAFNRRAIVFHHHPSTLWAYLKTKFRRGYWRMIVYRRFPRKAVKDSYTPKIIKIQTILMALSYPSVLFTLISPLFLGFACLLWMTILFTAIPFAAKISNSDKELAFLAPAIVFCRSAVFAAGSILGVIRSFFFPVPSQTTGAACG